MGAADFVNWGEGTEAADVFKELVEDAQYDYGHAGYTGTIAEKGSFVVIRRDPLPLREAEKLAYELIEADDDRISDKWGPAGAIPVSLPARTTEVTGLSFVQGEDVTPAATEELRKKGELRKGEEVESVSLTSYRYDSHTYSYSTRVRCYDGRARVRIKKADTAPRNIDGWLFCGWASS